MIPADFAGFETTLDTDTLRGAEAARVRVVVTHIALLAFLQNLVSTDGLINDWPGEKREVVRMIIHK